jgi:hypothetical protein
VDLLVSMYVESVMDLDSQMVLVIVKVTFWIVKVFVEVLQF